MAFNVKEQPEIKANILRDIANLLPNLDISDDSDDSDYAVRASATSAAAEGLYQHQLWIYRQIFPDTADADIMEIHAALKNLKKKVAVNASGTIHFTGTPAANVPIGTEAKNTNGIAFITTASGVLDGSGNATIAAQALLAGSAGNVADGTSLNLTAAPNGVNAVAIIGTMRSGTDIETDESLLARLLFVLQNPPSSGNKADYKRWAEEVDGVDQAQVYPLRRGLGTTDVIITSGGGLPSLALIEAVEAHINALRNCGVNTLEVLAPSVITQNFTIQVAVSGITLIEAQAAINNVLDQYFASLLPGEILVKSKIESAISAVVGITDRAVSQPAANVVPLANAAAVQWLRKGTVTVSLMA